MESTLVAKRRTWARRIRQAYGRIQDDQRERGGGTDNESDAFKACFISVALISAPLPLVVVNVAYLVKVRAKVTETLQDRQTANKDYKRDIPAPTDEILVINELVKEYLEWNGYLYTASVLTSEAALPKEPKTRMELCAEVGVRDDEKSSALPLLSNIVAAYTERIKRKINKSKRDYS